MKAPIAERDRGFHRNIVRSARINPVKKATVLDLAYSRHEGIYRSYLEKSTKDLGKGHPIKMLLSEHKEIVCVLDQLDRVRDELEQTDQFESVTVELWQHLMQTMDNVRLVHFHFHKEEDILFPELVERGRYVDVQRVLAEHRKVHTLIFQLITVFERGISDDFVSTTKAIKVIASGLSEKMRRLMYQENYFIYPMALRLISEDRTWERIKADCRGVGSFHLVKSVC